MYPVYRCMDSNPHLMNLMSYAPHHDPSFGAFPSHMKVDPTKSPLIYDSWPSGGTYGYLYSPQCHRCSNHDHFPDYNGFRPPYPHFPPPSPLHCYSSYPMYPGTHPFHSIPPPHYSVGQPRYEFDKNTPRDQHCCGCAHHTCDQKENFMKIAEQDPDAQNKSSDSLVPFKLKNYLYPVMWIPPSYMKNEEGRKPDDSKAKEGDKYQFDTSNCNGWLPVDINRLGSLKQDGDERKTEQQKNEDKNQFPFPIFWMPYKPEEVERDDFKKTNDGEETRKDFGVNPIKLPDNDDRKSQCRSHEGNYASQVGLKTVDSGSVKKVIPVKQAEHHQEKNISKDKESARGIIVEQIKENGGKKSSEDTSERQSNSPTKISKLPPVCLRVDPLPRKKSINGRPTSPSPPANKGKLVEASTDNLKSAVAKEKILHGVESPNHVKKSCQEEDSGRCEKGDKHY
ncbi:hypothetical protein RJ639_043820 [Escallonia herrerae]|uniref:Uncharacterized protein n=1 Tax=Escallonia herrerae TaxID=1293975 RepID=A0AA88WF94_9ASTE|nr:hypothetical protein RJ639_043820 [Escallonia herrerae]